MKIEIPGIEIDTREESLQIWGRDWTRFHEVRACAVAFPRTVVEISQVLRFCQKAKIGVVPSGGRTGLASGAVATKGELVLSLAKMDKILGWSPMSQTLNVEAGAVHEKVQEYLRPMGFQWPIDLASKGSCQIGGNLATNAGGLRVLRYGHARRWVQSLKVVFSDGSVADLNGALEKNNTGPCLKDLIIGSEGTLGVIAEARLKVAPLAQNRMTLLAPMPELRDALSLLERCRTLHIPLLSFEIMAQNCIDRVVKHLGIEQPFAHPSLYYVLIDIEGLVAEDLPEALALPESTLVGGSESQCQKLWRYRENITESLSQLGFVYKHDLAFPIETLKDFLTTIHGGFPAKFPGAELYVFGHLGDGNLHLNIVYPGHSDRDKRLKHCTQMNDWIFSELQKAGGSIAAEHGLGLLKGTYAHYSKSQVEIDFLRQIKKVLDPHNILNPGKGLFY